MFGHAWAFFGNAPGNAWTLFWNETCNTWALFASVPDNVWAAFGTVIGHAWHCSKAFLAILVRRSAMSIKMHEHYLGQYVNMPGIIRHCHLECLGVIKASRAMPMHN